MIELEGKNELKNHIEEHCIKGKKRRRLIIAVETSYDGQEGFLKRGRLSCT